jgi:DnaJ-class molecular chaperone
MPMVSCKGCGGSGRMPVCGRYAQPQSWREINCPGCGGDGKVTVPDPNESCAQCGGHGKIFVPPLTGSFDMSGGHDIVCQGCKGSGYAT